jgi:PAS domain S-box-containing protein
MQTKESRNNWFSVRKNQMPSAPLRELFDLKTYKFLAASGGILYCLWALVFSHFVPGNYDPWVLRLMVSGIMFFLAVAPSFSSFVKTHYKYFFITSLWIISFHYLYVWKANHLSIEYSMGLFVLVSALSAHLRTLNALSASESRFKLLTDHLRVGVILLNPVGEILEVNPSGLRILGADRLKEVVGKTPNTFWTLINESGEEIPLEERPLTTVLRTKLPVYNCVVCVKNGQSDIWVKMNIDLIQNEENLILGFIASLTDITEQRLAEEELHQARGHAQNQARLVSIGEMAGGIAHEINNPLAIIELKLDYLKACLNDTELDRSSLRHTIETIVKTSQRIASIIKSLRYFSRDGSGDPFSPATLKSILENTLALCQERFANHGIKLTIPKLDDNLIIECSQVQIHQVILNLLNNAFDAVEKRSNKWVTIEIEDGTSEVKIILTDSGPGIPAAVAVKMFHPFFTTKEVGKGTGLGLSISKGIVNRHNGRLEIDRNKKNTSFVLSLPKKQPIPETNVA